jgi:ribose 5-phosphate isomerase A
MIEKQTAAKKAAEFIKNGMTIGLGTGSTVSFFIRELSEKVKEGLKINAVSTSHSTTQLASSLGIEIIDLDQVSHIDLTIDGADEVDENLNGIKGGGGALLYEKIVAKNSEKNIWIVDSSKMVKKLGEFPLPVEVIKFGSEKLMKIFSDLNYNPEFRMEDKEKYITDADNHIIDLNLKTIENAAELDKRLKLLTGVVETGLFCDTAEVVIVGKHDRAEIIEKKRSDHRMI